MEFYNKDNYLESATADGVLSESDLDKILSLYDQIDQPVRTLLELTGDISITLLRSGLQEKHCIFGGYAVLAHLVNRFGDQFIPAWRRSDDLDIVGTEDVLRALKYRYKIKASLSENIASKYTLKVPGDNAEEYKIDYLVRPISQQEEITVLGVPIKVMAPLPLIKGKITPALTQEKHQLDVMHLLGILEHRNIPLHQIVQQLQFSERRKLYDVIQKGFDPHSRVSIGPTVAYARDLRGELLNQTFRDACAHPSSQI